MNLVQIITSLRTAYIWVNGYERTALVAYQRTIGEVIHVVARQ